MGVLSKILVGSGADLVKNLGNSIDQVVTSKEEKLELKNKLREMELDFSKALNEEVSERWKADMSANGNWLTKSVRPVVFISLVFTYIFMILNGTYTNMQIYSIQNVALTVISAYIGSRGIEKGIGLITNNGTVNEVKKKAGFFKRLFKKK